MPTPPSAERHQRFLALLQPIEGELETYARRMVWRREDAQDVLQNAVMRAFAAFDRYHEDASFRAWLYQILTNEIFTTNRRHARPATISPKAARTTSVPSPTPTKPISPSPS